MDSFHNPVLLKESLELLQVKKNGLYIDATLGGGGHALGIVNLGAVVLGLDQDEEALDYVSNTYETDIKNSKLILVKGNFRDIDKLAHLKNFSKVDGIIYDLGVSSHQIDTPERGFSFLRNGPLDMRMDKEESVTAEVLVNLLSKEDLTEIFTKYGEDKKAYSIARQIVKLRKTKAIQTTGELSRAIAKAYGIKGEVPDFAKNEINKRIFQALRIAVNRELDSISESLPKAYELIKENGRLAVITFHSLEDSLVKKIFEDFEKQNMGRIINKMPVTATEEELRANSRSKSAKLRVFEKN